MENKENKPQIGVSACLLGEPVRFDGGHKRNQFILQQCARFFNIHSVCPEAELGLGIPRPVIQLRKFDNEVRLVFSRNPEQELTPSMREFSHQRSNDFQSLDGFIFKKDSPTCGMERVPVVDNKTGMRERNGTGIFAATFKKLHPQVPTEEEGRLNDIKIRENFLERVYAHYRWRLMDSADNKLQNFRLFHTNYKLVLMAKSPVVSRELGQLVAGVNAHNLDKIKKQYFAKFMQVMAKIPSRGNHVNVLMHLMGYLKNKLDARDKAELLEWFHTYRQQQVNRITPLVLLQHHFRRHPNEYITGQYYFSPFPATLMQPF